MVILKKIPCEEEGVWTLILQKMMRGRIVAQGFTIMALLTGIMVSVRKSLPSHWPSALLIWGLGGRWT